MARHNYISPTKVQEIFDLYVRIKRKSFPEIICIDEVYAMKDNHSKYFLLLDFKTHELIDMLPERKNILSLVIFEKILYPKKIKCTLFHHGYVRCLQRCCSFRFPRANIAIDSFHVVKNINDALNNVIQNTYYGGWVKKSIEYYLLKNFNWLLLEKKFVKVNVSITNA